MRQMQLPSVLQWNVNDRRKNRGSRYQSAPSCAVKWRAVMRPIRDGEARCLFVENYG
jgi:hypothetical protein